MNQSPRASIIVLNWNGLQDTLVCLELVRAESWTARVGQMVQVPPVVTRRFRRG